MERFEVGASLLAILIVFIYLDRQIPLAMTNLLCAEGMLRLFIKGPVIKWPLSLGCVSSILCLVCVKVSEGALQGGCFHHVHLKRADLSGQIFNTSML